MNNLAFSGFSPETFKFFTQLKVHNDKIWFNENRSVFDNNVLPEAQAFVVTVGEKLKQIVPDVVAIPKTDKSIFRIYRDTRFSPDKTPYKTHLGIFFWEGPLKKMECSGFYFQLNPEYVFFGVGMHQFPPQVLEVYRKAVADETIGASLNKMLEKVKAGNKFDLGWTKYKRVPRGYDADHPDADLLKHGGLGFSCQRDIPANINSADFASYCMDIFEAMAPVHFWLRDLLYSNF